MDILEQTYSISKIVQTQDFLQVWAQSKIYFANELHPPWLYQTLTVYSLKTYQIKWLLPRKMTSFKLNLQRELRVFFSSSEN